MKNRRIEKKSKQASQNRRFGIIALSTIVHPSDTAAAAAPSRHALRTGPSIGACATRSSLHQCCLYNGSCRCANAKIHFTTQHAPQSQRINNSNSSTTPIETTTIAHKSHRLFTLTQHQCNSRPGRTRTTRKCLVVTRSLQSSCTCLGSAECDSSIVEMASRIRTTQYHSHGCAGSVSLCTRFEQRSLVQLRMNESAYREVITMQHSLTH